MTGTEQGMPRAAGPWPVGAVAAHLGVTVRTLHHWDDTGLVRASERSASGYRLYTAADLERLHRVLIYREIEVPLAEIPALLDASAGDAEDALTRQQERVRERIALLERRAAALDRLLRSRERGILLSDEEQWEIFGAGWNPRWQDEARERWGGTEQWAQAAERAADRSPAQWGEISARMSELTEALADALRAGVLPGSDEANALAERHRASIGEFFRCSRSMQVCLARGYVTDERFRSFYDAREPGLASWLSAVVDAHARTHGIDPETAVWE